MKRVLILIAAVLVVGCASAPKEKYVHKPELEARTLRIAERAYNCMKPGKDVHLNYVQNEDICAWIDDGGTPSQLYICDGLSRREDDFLYFAILHEMAHVKLGHTTKKRVTSIATTAGFVVLGVFIPGAGLLNHAVNPAAVAVYSKEAELDADRLAAQSAERCFGILPEDIVLVLEELKRTSPEGGGVFQHHPVWDERIQNIRSLSK